MSELPKGWVETTVGAVCDVLDSQRIPVNSRERQGRLGKIPYYGATGQVGWIDKPIFDEELILLGEDGAPFLDAAKSKAYLIKGPSWVNNHAHVLRANATTSNQFLLHYLNGVDYRHFVNGTTRLKLTQGAMNTIPVRLPPVPSKTASSPPSRSSSPGSIRPRRRCAGRSGTSSGCGKQCWRRP